MTELQMNIPEVLNRLTREAMAPECQVTPGLYQAVKALFEMQERGVFHEAVMPAIVMTSVHLTRLMQGDNWLRDLKAADAVLLTLTRDDLFIQCVVHKSTLVEVRNNWMKNTREQAAERDLEPDELARAWVASCHPEFFEHHPLALAPMLLGAMDKTEFEAVQNEPSLFAMSCLVGHIPESDNHCIVQFQGMQYNAGPSSSAAFPKIMGNA